MSSTTLSLFGTPREAIAFLCGGFPWEQPLLPRAILEVVDALLDDRYPLGMQTLFADTTNPTLGIRATLAKLQTAFKRLDDVDFLQDPERDLIRDRCQMWIATLLRAPWC